MTESNCCEQETTCENCGTIEESFKSPLKFKELTINSLPLIYPYLQASGSMSCDYTAGGLYMWIDYFKYKYCIHEDTLLIKGVAEDNRKQRAFSLPIGKMPTEKAVRMIREYCEERDFECVFSAITEERIDDFRKLNPKAITPLEHWGDYIYPASQLATLAGKKMNKKRNHCNKFAAEHPEARLEKIGNGNIEAVKECFRKISETPADSPMADFERRQAWKVMENLEKYPFEAACLMTNDGVVAFSVGEVTGNTLHVHIEKALHDVSGAGETINRDFVRMITEEHAEVEYVNREDDAGDEGLRQAKQSYNPLMVLKKYNVEF
jgi:uncharacterized protein